MFNKFFEKRFAGFEEKKRQGLGDRKFLEKYIVSLERNRKLFSIFFPAVIILYLTAAILWTFLYVADGKVFELIITIILWIIAIMCGFGAFIFYTHHFKFWKAKVELWKQELQALNAVN